MLYPVSTLDTKEQWQNFFVIVYLVYVSHGQTFLVYLLKNDKVMDWP